MDSEERRCWLREKYPIEVGLGDLVKEYVAIKTETNYESDEQEQTLRAAEILSVLNYLLTLNHVPAFSNKFGTFYL